LVDQPESARVRDLVGNEPVVLQSYAEFEAELVLLALRLVGEISPHKEARIGRVLADFRGMEPFLHRALPYNLAKIAR